MGAGHDDPQVIATKKAEADYSSTGQYLLMAISTTADQFVKASVAGQKVFGPLVDNPASGVAGALKFAGLAKVVLGGTVDEGDKLTTDANAKGVKSTSPQDYVFGEAFEPGVVNDPILVRMSHTGFKGQPVLVTFHYKLTSMADGDIITTYTPGFAGKITKFSALVTDPVTTASDLTTLNLEIGTTDLTGGALALTSANMTPLGAVVDSTAITAANVFSATDTISMEASATTAFAEGEIAVIIKLEPLD